MIRLFIGTSSNGEDNYIEAVYEYTLRKNCTDDLDIVWMRQTHDQESYWHGFQTKKWPTPFSGYRWAIPEYCNFEGRAIYTDVDMINFRDIKELWETPLDGKPIAARTGTRFGGYEFCVMVLDCNKMKDVVIPINRQRSMEEYHQRCIGRFSGNHDLVAKLDPRWNTLDGDGREVSDIYQLHWTKMATQPWKPKWFTGVPDSHPRKDLVKLLTSLSKEAETGGYLGQDPVHPYINMECIGR
jgi:hypothetical protein